MNKKIVGMVQLGASGQPESADEVARRYFAHIKTRTVQLPESLIADIYEYLENSPAEDPFIRINESVRLCYTQFQACLPYTLATDDKHYALVMDNVRHLLSQDHNNPQYRPLLAAAAGHDLERWFDHDGSGEFGTGYGVAKLNTLVSRDHPQAKELQTELKRLDESLRKVEIHPWASLRLMGFLMEKCGLDEGFQLKVKILIRFHDTPPEAITPEKIEAEFPGHGLDISELMSEIKLLGQADAMVFFQTPTIKLFLEERIDITPRPELVSRLAKNLKKMGTQAETAYEAGLASIQGEEPTSRHDDSGIDLIDPEDTQGKAFEIGAMQALLTEAWKQI